MPKFTGGDRHNHKRSSPQCFLEHVRGDKTLRELTIREMFRVRATV